MHSETSLEYKILNVPITKDKSVFYYYRRYTNKQDKSKGNSQQSTQIATLPEDRTLYVCHFNRAIEESFVQKYFGMAGKVKQVHLGEYKNKANNKRKRRTVYFALVVYKSASDVAALLQSPKVL